MSSSAITPLHLMSSDSYIEDMHETTWTAMMERQDRKTQEKVLKLLEKQYEETKKRMDHLEKILCRWELEKK